MTDKDIMDKEFEGVQVHFDAQKLFKIFKRIELQAEEAGHDDILDIALELQCLIRDQVQERYNAQ